MSGLVARHYQYHDQTIDEQFHEPRGDNAGQNLRPLKVSHENQQYFLYCWFFVVPPILKIK